MAQPVAGFQWTQIGTIGTTVVSNKDTVLRGIMIPGTYVGTVKFHDAASAAGTSATSNFFTMGLPLTSTPFSIGGINLQCKKGLVVESTGTPTLTFTWGD